MDIPRAGGRLFETGVEEFLRLKTDGGLGASTLWPATSSYGWINKWYVSIAVPIIAIFTKYDKLVNDAELDIDEECFTGLDDAGIAVFCRKAADTAFKELCITPFEAVVQQTVPHVAVSSESYALLLISRSNREFVSYQPKKDTKKLYLSWSNSHMTTFSSTSRRVCQSSQRSLKNLTLEWRSMHQSSEFLTAFPLILTVTHQID